jgi:asparagine synthase (glutamine-hydrolysing)
VTAVELSDHRPWTRNGTVAACGRAFRGDDPLAGERLCEQFAGVASLADFADALDELNGFFAAVVESENGALLGADHVRSVPLVYAPELDIASDDPGVVADRVGDTYDPLAESELLVSGVVLGDRTLLPGVRTVPPGAAVRLADGSAEVLRYTAYDAVDAPADESDGGATGEWTDGVARADESDGGATDDGQAEWAARARVETAIDAAFDRFAWVVGDRRVALALSGGADSRLVAAELARRDVDLLTYSFGRPDAEDVRVAREVAAALEVPWEFVEYSTDQWRAWYRSPEREAYVDEAFYYEGIPNYGSLPALSHLRARGSIDERTVCTSGQTVAGLSEEVPREIDTAAPTRAALVEGAVTYLARWQWENPAFDRALRVHLDAAIEGGEVDSLADAFGRYEAWKLGERHTKYYVAEAREYDYLDLEWWLPLWDRAVVDAWATVPFARRRDKALYRSIVADRFAAAAGLTREEAAGLSVEYRAPTLAGRLVDAAAERVVDSPVAPLLRGAYWRLQRRRSDYGDHPLGWYGIVSPELFARLYSGREDVHALQALETVGRASFVGGTVTDPPRDGVLPLPYTGEDR